MRAGVAALLLVAAVTLVPAAAQDQPFSLPDTKVVSLISKDGSHAFRLLIGLPRGDASRNERFPVVYLLDADFSFASTQDILRHSTDRGREKEAIIVGITYPGADTDLKIYERMRTRDYTPTHTADGGYSAEIQALSGGGPKFLSILKDDIVPAIDAQYRTDPAERMLVGHSFGAPFACYAMLTKPGLFHDYLVVSPSLWYDDRVMFGLAAQMMVFDGETHESVFPAALTRDLRLIDDYAGEAAGNTLEQQKQP
jgi:predicted alpha/beta superfamily hydrolase